MGGLGRRMAAIAAAGMLAMGAAAPASAGMIGGAVTSQYYAYGTKSGGASVFTADGQAHARTHNTFEVVVTSTQIIYDFGVTLATGTWSSSGASLDRDGLWIRNGNLLSFDGAPDIVGVTIDPTTNMAGLTASGVSFNEAAIAIDWMGLSYDSRTRVVLNVETASINPAAVSEPAALVMAGLAGLGLGGAALLRRRRGARLA